MGKKTTVFPDARLAAVIVKFINNVQEVNFSVEGKGSLVHKISNALKIANTSNFRMQLKNNWCRKDSSLRSSVVSLLHAKKKGHQDVSETKGADNIDATPRSPCSKATSNAAYIENSTEKVVNDWEDVKHGDNTFKIINVAGDGNCLFRCLAYFVLGNQELHSTIRQRIVEYTTANWQEECSMLASTCPGKGYKNADEYSKVMGSSGTYGTDYELGIFVRLYGVTVTVFLQENKQEPVKQAGKLEPSNDKAFAFPLGRHLQIMLRGPERSGHWVVLEAKPSKVSIQCDKLVESSVTEKVNQEDRDISTPDSGVFSNENKCVKNGNVSALPNAAKNKTSDQHTTLVQFTEGVNSIEIPSAVTRDSEGRVSQGPEQNKNGAMEITADERSIDSVSPHVLFQSESSTVTNDQKVHSFVERTEQESRYKTKRVQPRKEKESDPYQFTTSSHEGSDSEASVDNSNISFELTKSERKRIGRKRTESIGQQSSIQEEKVQPREEKKSDPYKFTTSSHEESDSEASVDSSNNSFDLTKSERKRIGRKHTESIGQQSSIEYSTDSEPDRIGKRAKNFKNRVKMNSKVVKKNVFIRDLGTVEIPSTNFKTELGYNSADVVRSVIDKIMSKTFKCTCILSFYGSVRYNLQDVVAYAKCNKPDHEQRFQFRIDHLEEPLARLQISSNKKLKVVHKPSTQAERCRAVRGPERRKLQNALQNTRATEILAIIDENLSSELDADGHPQDKIRPNTLHKMKSEVKSKLRLSLKSFDLSDLIEFCIQEQKLKDPFLRFVSLPLTAIMFTEEDLFAIIGQKPIILHMDATGSIVRKPQYLTCKRIFYYCILAKHDSSELITLAHMITSEHGVLSISTFLKQYRYFVMATCKKWPLANAVTIDWSWAFIHSILQEWNGTTIKSYLNIMYKCCEQNMKPPKEMCILKICFAHFMKIVSRTIHESYPEYKNFKGMVLECMALISLSRNLRQLDEIFKHVCTLLTCRGEKEANDSIVVIKKLGLKNSGKMKEIQEAVNSSETDEFVEILSLKKQGESIYRNSPFFRRYSDIMGRLQMEMGPAVDDDIENKKNRIGNKYYAPKFVDHLITTWMPYVILWASLDLDFVDPTISRVSNAYAESAFRVMKHVTFKGLTNSSITDRIRELKASRMTTIARVYLNAKLKGTTKSRQKPKYPQIESDPFIKESWQKKTHAKKRGRGYGEAPLIKKLCQRIEETEANNNTEKMNTNTAADNKSNQERRMLKVEEAECIIETHTEDKTRNKQAKKEESNPMRNVKANVDITECQVENDDGLASIETLAKQQIPRKKVNKFYNGLMKDVNYYMSSESRTLPVGRYFTKKSMSIDLFQLTVKQYSTIRGQRWIDGIVIDSFAAANLDEWPSMSYIPTDDTAMIIGDYSTKRIDRNRKICRSKHAIEDKLLMPYLFHGHWRLLVADIKQKKLILLDPFKYGTDNVRAIDAFKNFLRFCGSGSSLNQLQSIKWEEHEITARPYQSEKDGHSCGSYVLYYMHCLGRSKALDINFDPAAYRLEVAYELLLKSENMEDMCVHCFISTGTSTKTCQMCERKCHTTCLHKSEMNTDDEDRETESGSKRKTERKDNSSDYFICKLCKRYTKGQLCNPE